MIGILTFAVALFISCSVAGCAGTQGGVAMAARPPSADRPEMIAEPAPAPETVVTVDLTPESTVGDLRRSLAAVGHGEGRIRIAMGATEITARVESLSHDYFAREPFASTIGLGREGAFITTSIGFVTTDCRGQSDELSYVAGHSVDGYETSALRSCFGDWPHTELVSFVAAASVTMRELYAVIEAAQAVDPVLVLELPCWFDGIQSCREADGSEDLLGELMRERSPAFDACQATALERNGSLPNSLSVHVVVFPDGVARCESRWDREWGRRDDELVACLRRVACTFERAFYYTVETNVVLRGDEPSAATDR